MLLHPEVRDDRELDCYVVMPESTLKLVLLVHHFVWMLVNRPDPVFEDRFRERWLAQFESCLRAAEESGDLERTGLSAEIRGRCVHDLALSFAKNFADSAPSFDDRPRREKLVRSAVVFALRGIGFTHEVLKAHYKLGPEDDVSSVLSRLRPSRTQPAGSSSGREPARSHARNA
jgi:hypothetical protein